jgi:uncharacterized protein YqfA (UPF0365 family)
MHHMARKTRIPLTPAEQAEADERHAAAAAAGRAAMMAALDARPSGEIHKLALRVRTGAVPLVIAGARALQLGLITGEDQHGLTRVKFWEDQHACTAECFIWAVERIVLVAHELSAQPLPEPC